MAKEEFTPPRTTSDLSAIIIELLTDRAGDEVEKVDHQDDGTTETLVFKFSNGHAFQVEVNEVEERP